jgi:hypothetical protein
MNQNATILGSNEDYAIMHPCLSCGIAYYDDNFDPSFCTLRSCDSGGGCCDGGQKCCEGGYEYETEFWTACYNIFSDVNRTMVDRPFCGESQCSGGEGPGFCGLFAPNQEEPPPGASD